MNAAITSAAFTAISGARIGTIAMAAAMGGSLSAAMNTPIYRKAAGVVSEKTSEAAKIVSEKALEAVKVVAEKTAEAATMVAESIATNCVSSAMTEEEAKNIIVRAMRFHRRRFVNAVLANGRDGLSDKMFVAMECIYDIYANQDKVNESLDRYVNYTCAHALYMTSERVDELTNIVKQQCEPGCAKRKVFRVFMMNLNSKELENYKEDAYDYDCGFDNGHLPKLW